MSSQPGRIAVVIIHGMGNQFPMDTLRGFVNAIKPETSTLYSSPNRITEEKETRRLSFDSGPYDFYEYYWAHYMEEPGIIEILKWSSNLLFFKTPSARLKPHLLTIGAVVIFIILVIAGLGIWWYSILDDYITKLVSVTLAGTALFIFFKLIAKLISGTVVGRINNSLGDVIKYTVPSPNNIATREQIRKNGIELIKNLHDAKKEGGGFKYGQIIVIGHSLGTIVAYDVLTSLFSQYHKKYSKIPAKITQEALKKIRDYKGETEFPIAEFQTLQGQLYEEYRNLGNEWRISNFITMGSPLTHASMILARSKEDLQRKENQREFPVCPPQWDKRDDHFAFPVTYQNEAGGEVKITTLHHAAHFAVTKWTNIYFENDWIGGSIANVFGPGIRDIAVRASDKRISKIPLASHTKYWDRENSGSLNILKELFNTIEEL